VATAKREAIFPDVPTFAEAGVADFEVSTWYGLFAPKATPDGPLDVLHGAVQAALASEDIKRIWAEQGARVDLESRPAFADFVRHEVELWSRIAKTVNIPME
jgi:tripartite-type tricarboxylate transporter receptor subunit TctC